MAEKKDTGKVILSWETGRVRKNKNAIYWVAGFFIVILASIGYFGYINQWSSVAVFFLLLITTIWYVFISVKTVKVSISEGGFWLDGVFYSFENIKGYWVVEDSGLFYFVTKGRFSSNISFPLGETPVNKIIALLPQELVRVENMGEDLHDKIARLFNI
ncbi:MAG TPA: hypothetical protein P5096_01585 [Patescibacteria group bacterium]|nr:hypothetical protein [Patescibacteria group bacterium]